MLQAKLGASKAAAYDINMACTGFVGGLTDVYKRQVRSAPRPLRGAAPDLKDLFYAKKALHPKSA